MDQIRGKQQFCRVRYFMDISYRGTNFNGWQIQPNGITIQDEIEKALTTLLKSETAVTGSGRTDTGVHATQQIAHFDSEGLVDGLQLAHKLNSFLGPDIAINGIRQVQENAHARFQAEKRMYYYKIHQAKDPFMQGLSYHFAPKMNIAQINKACKILLEWENFECFSKVHTEVNHFNCDIQFAKWSKIGPKNQFVISADRFLRGMVRAIVGTLIEVGLEKINLVDFEQILQSRDRSKAGRAVPPEGLYLQEVLYPADIYID